MSCGMDPQNGGDTLMHDASLSSPITPFFNKTVSAYTVFFQEQREQIREEHSEFDVRKSTVSKRKDTKTKGDFTKLASTIATKWRGLSNDEKGYYETLALGRNNRSNEDWKPCESVHDVRTSARSKLCKSPSVPVSPSQSGAKKRKQRRGTKKRNRPASTICRSGSSTRPRFQFSIGAPQPMVVAPRIPFFPGPLSEVSRSSSQSSDETLNSDDNSLLISDPSHSSEHSEEDDSVMIRPLLSVCNVLESYDMNATDVHLVNRELLDTLEGDMGNECQALFLNLFSHY